MGGGTAGWIAALKFLVENKRQNLNLKVTLISSEEIGTIGVGEGSTPLFVDYIDDVCQSSVEDFLHETKGAIKYGIKFDNWNFDNEYYYHLFTSHSSYENSNLDLIYNFCQYAINNNLNIPQRELQKKIHGVSFDLVDDNFVNFNINSRFAYHFDAKLIVKYFKSLADSFSEFTYINDKIIDIKYNNEKIESLTLENNGFILGDFFINSLGLHDKSNSQDIEELSIIPNNKAITLQVKNIETDALEPYTTSTAQDYGWTWKIPQYEKTGYGYVYSDHFVNDEDSLYDKIIESYKIDEKNIIRSNKVSFKSFYNKKQLKSNCLYLGLSSGFLEPLEATSINLTLTSLNLFFDLANQSHELETHNIKSFNETLSKIWEGVKNFIIMHYFNGSNKNDYWRYFNSLNSNSKLFKMNKDNYHNVSFAYTINSFYSITLGLNSKDFSYSQEENEYIKNHIETFFMVDHYLDSKRLMTQNEILNCINLKN